MSTARGPDAVAEARSRRDHLDGWLRAFIASYDDAGPCEYGAAVAGGATSVPRGGGHQTWGWTDRGPTRTPWRADRSPGGSSAGSAAAVAAGIVPLATGADGAGAPEPGGAATVSRGSALRANGPGRRATDPGHRPTDPDRRPTHPGHRSRGPGGRWTASGTAAWSPDLGFAGADLDPGVVAVARSAAQRWVSCAGLEEIEVPLRLHDPAPAWAALRRPGASPAALRAANALRRANDRALWELFERVDLLLTPATPAGPHGHDGPGGRMNVALTWGFNLSGHPAVSVPAGIGPDGCPVGLQVVARPGEDDRLLVLLERHQPVAGVV